MNIKEKTAQEFWVLLTNLVDFILLKNKKERRLKGKESAGITLESGVSSHK